MLRDEEASSQTEISRSVTFREGPPEVAPDSCSIIDVQDESIPVDGLPADQDEGQPVDEDSGVSTSRGDQEPGSPLGQPQHTPEPGEAGGKKKKKCPIMMTGSQAALLPIVRATAKGCDGKALLVNVLLDTASTVNVVQVGTHTLLETIDVEPTVSLDLFHVNGSHGLDTKIIKFTLITPEGVEYQFDAYLLERIFSVEHLNVDREKMIAFRDVLDLNVVDFSRPVQIDILLGVTASLRLMEKKSRFGQTYLVTTPWGSTPCGDLLLASDNHCYATSIETLNKTLERFWKLDDLPNDHVVGLTRDEHLAVQLIEKHLSRDPETGRFSTALLFRSRPSLSNNYPQALCRFKALCRKLVQNADLAKAYRAAMQEFIDGGVVEKISIDPDAKTENTGEVYYLPHRAVYDPSRVSTKCRIVFDASAKTKDGKSLNDYLLAGPALQRDIMLLALKFRTRSIVLTGDVAKMFLNIDVVERDRDYLRFLWKEPTDPGPPDVYRSRTLIFGATDSPFQAITCLQKLAQAKMADPEITDLERKVCEVIRRDMYVDDISTGGDTCDELKVLMGGIQTLLNSAHFFVRKWRTNSAELLSFIPENERGPTKLRYEAESEDDDLVSEVGKMLGVMWDPEEDTIQFPYENLGLKNDNTKTALASIQARIFDPLGLVSPFTLRAKLIIKEAHRQKIGWKELIPADIEHDWSDWLSQLPALAKVTFDRKVRLKEDTELHVFTDASRKGMGVSVYLRNRIGDGAWEARLFAAKSKVAPMKEETIPRLELSAALIGARLAVKIAAEFGITHNHIFCWSDSQIVLYWLDKEPQNLIPFVANRVEEIRKYRLRFSYVRTDENPADMASRGCAPEELGGVLWREGPEFLRLPESQWIRVKLYLSEDDQRQGIKKHCVYTNVTLARNVRFHLAGQADNREVPLEEYYSSMDDLLRVTARVIKISKIWLQKIRANVAYKDDYRVEALQLLIRDAQRMHFAKEYQALMANQPLNAKSTLKVLNPYLDKSTELIRVGGRLAKSDLSDEVKHPIVLPKMAHLTALIIRDAHISAAHAGVDWVHHHLRQRYWILSSRQIVRSVVKNCFTCRRYDAPRANQLMAPLPHSRVSQQVPFSHVGVDFAGTINVKDNDKDLANLLIFTCFTTRAVHIELTAKAGLNDFLLAFKRMINTRGYPTHVYSDNAKTFKAAGEAVTKIPFFAARKIIWRYSTPEAPHTGGVWERMVQLVKKPLRKVLPKRKLTYEALATLCKEVEAMVNDRPLFVTSSDTMEVITPSLLCLGRRIQTLTDVDENPPAGTVALPSSATVRTWVARSRLMDQVWRQWVQQYFPNLQKLHRWKDTYKNLKPGDIVVVEQQLLKRHEWPLARVEKIHQGSDSLVRSVDLVIPIQGGGGRVNRVSRNIHNLVPLELANEPDMIDEIEENLDRPQTTPQMPDDMI